MSNTLERIWTDAELAEESERRKLRREKGLPLTPTMPRKDREVSTDITRRRREAECVVDADRIFAALQATGESENYSREKILAAIRRTRGL